MIKKLTVLFASTVISCTAFASTHSMRLIAKNNTTAMAQIGYYSMYYGNVSLGTLASGSEFEKILVDDRDELVWPWYGGADRVMCRTKDEKSSILLNPKADEATLSFEKDTDTGKIYCLCTGPGCVFQ